MTATHDPLTDVAPGLLHLLRTAGNEYGPAGVAHVAATLADIPAPPSPGHTDDMHHVFLDDPDVPVRTHVWRDYSGIDPGIRFAVRVLHARGYETCQSCEGGPGHAYHRPAVDLPAGPADAAGFAALATLVGFGLPVYRLSQVWNVDVMGRPYETIWRIEFREAFPEMADRELMFLYGYQAQQMTGDPA